MRALLWGAAYYGLGRLGLLTALDDVPFTLVAPAAGLGVVWFSTATRRTLPFDLAALSVATLLLSWELGLPGWIVLTGPITAAAQLGCFVYVLRYLSPDLAPFGRRTAWRLRDLGAFGVAAVSASLVSASMSTGLQHLADLPTGDLFAFVVRWSRSAATMISIGSAGLLLVGTLRGAGFTWSPATWRPRLPRTHVVEGVALLAASVATYVAVFYTLEAYPLTFAVFIVTAWAGARFTPVATGWHALLVGAIAVLFTLGGHGRFATLEDPVVVALLAQLFVMVMTGIGLTLAISRSELAAAEQLAEDRAELLDDVLRDAEDGVLLLDETGTFLFSNPAAGRLLRMRGGPDRFGTARPYTLHRLDGRLVTLQEMPFLRVLSGETVKGEEYELRWSDGSPARVIRVNAQLIAAPPGSDRRVLIGFHDVTADRLREEALVSFAGHVAHDLQNPLTIVHTWTEILHDSFESGESVDADEGLMITSKVLRGSGRMKDFIHELLDYTVARDQALRPQELDVAAVAEDVASLRRGEASKTPAQITVVGSGAAWADPVLTRIVIDNLVSNAVKYVAPGVAPRITVALDQVEPEWLEVSVVDNGIGIAEEQRRRIFDSFVRLGAGTYEGTGLGLGICHRIVTRHGGLMAVRQVETGGSRVSFTLPTRMSAERPADHLAQRTQR